MSADPRVEVVVEALTLIPGTTVRFPGSTALTVLSALDAYDEAALRERIAAEIEALSIPPKSGSNTGYMNGLIDGYTTATTDAARIARGTT